MARSPSKIMSIAEKKVAQAGLKTALKAHNESVKAISTSQDDALKILKAAKKEADAQVKVSFKAYSDVLAQTAKAVAAATKAFDAASAKTAKAQAAAAKGTDKLTGQIAALDAVNAAPNVKVPKTKLVSSNTQSLTAQTATAGTA